MHDKTAINLVSLDAGSKYWLLVLLLNCRCCNGLLRVATLVSRN